MTTPATPVKPLPLFKVGERVVSLRGEPAIVTHVRVVEDPGKSHEVMVRWERKPSVDQALYDEELFGLLDYPPTRHAAWDEGTS